LQWTEQSYQVEPYGPVGIILFNPQIYARYVAVYRSTPNSSLILTEVEIYVSGKTAEFVTDTSFMFVNDISKTVSLEKQIYYIKFCYCSQTLLIIECQLYFDRNCPLCL